MAYTIAMVGALLGVIAIVAKAERVERVQSLPHGNAHSLAVPLLGGLSGFAFLVAGQVAHARRRGNRVGMLMSVIGVGFFVEDLQLSREVRRSTRSLVVAVCSASRSSRS